MQVVLLRDQPSIRHGKVVSKMPPVGPASCYSLFWVVACPWMETGLLISNKQNRAMVMGYQFCLLFWKLPPSFSRVAPFEAMLWGPLCGMDTVRKDNTATTSREDEGSLCLPILTTHSSLQRRLQHLWPLTTVMRKLVSEAVTQGCYEKANSLWFQTLFFFSISGIDCSRTHIRKQACVGSQWVKPSPVADWY